MSASQVQCSQCGVALPPECLNQPEFSACPGCGLPVRAEVFPALFRESKPGRKGEVVQLEVEASCFYHPQKRAVLPCDACGRFVCALCDCELNGLHLCPVCLEPGRKKGRIPNLENHRTLYDNIALSLAVYPLLIFYFTLVTAPMTIFIAFRYWNTPASLIRRTKIRFVIAMMLATLQLAGWAVGIYLAFTKLTSGS